MENQRKKDQDHLRHKENKQIRQVGRSADQSVGRSVGASENRSADNDQIDSRARAVHRTVGRSIERVGAPRVDDQTSEANSNSQPKKVTYESLILVPRVGNAHILFVQMIRNEKQTAIQTLRK